MRGAVTHHNAPMADPSVQPAPLPLDSSDAAQLRAEVDRLRVETHTLAKRAETAWLAWVDADSAWRASVVRRDRAVALSLAPTPTPPRNPHTSAVTPPTAETPQGPPPEKSHQPSSESSTRTVQNILFILGGLLLGTAAIVFTTVAWAAFGVGGRAAILAAATMLVLTLPVIALRRRLRATAETFAAVGFVLVLLDGYAAWHVDLFGATHIPASRFGGLVCAVTVLLAAGYHAMTRLRGPAHIALAVGQPVLPLLIAPMSPSAAGWALAFAAVAATNLGFVTWSRRTSADDTKALRAAGWVLHCLALAAASVASISAEATAHNLPSTVFAGTAVVAVAVVIAGAAWVSRITALHMIAAGVAVVAAVLAIAPIANTAWPGHSLILTAGVVAAVGLIARSLASAIVTRGGDRSTPAAVRHGALGGTLVMSGLLGVVVLAIATIAAMWFVVTVMPSGRPLPVDVRARDWQVLGAVGLTAMAIGSGLPRRAWLAVLICTGVVTTITLPAVVTIPWWTPSTMDIVGAALLGVVSVVANRASTTWVALAAAAMLGGHAGLVSISRPTLASTVFFCLAAIGTAMAWLSHRRSDDAAARHRISGAIGLAAGLTTLPAALATAATAAHAAPGWPTRAAVIGTGALVCAVPALRRAAATIFVAVTVAAIGSVLVWPTLAAAQPDAPASVYGGAALAALAVILLTDRRRPDHRAPVPADPTAGQAGSTAITVLTVMAAAPALFLFAAGVIDAVVAVLLSPYEWIGRAWSLTPTGTGLSPTAGRAESGFAADAVALALGAIAATIAALAVTGRRRAATIALLASGPVAVLVGLASTGARWPAVAAVSLGCGLALGLFVSVRRCGPRTTAICLAAAAAYAGAGVAGALAAPWSTVVWLAAVTVAGVIAGTAGATPASRTAGWLLAVTTGYVTVFALGHAVDLRLGRIALGVVGLAALGLAVSALLRQRRRGTAQEWDALAAASHAGAAVAFVFALTSEGDAALVCAVWGVVLGARALWPQTTPRHRWGLTVGGLACELAALWLMLLSWKVTVVEAYSVPLAAVGVFAGWRATRSRPELHSWVGYGPALAAGFLPTLAAALGPGDTPVRRLALGVAATVTVLIGSTHRRQAPVVVGGLVLSIMALAETARFWDLLPRWIPLAAGGLVLVGLAMTYERRLRDMRRVRDAVRRMR